jgi:hypothetical protein
VDYRRHGASGGGAETEDMSRADSGGCAGEAGRKVIRVSFSGGRDSTALALYLKGEGHEVELVLCDTGAELPETLSFAPWFARQIGARLYVVSGPTFFQQITAFGYLLPSARVRWCTRELKQKPLEKYTGLAVGICADEDRLEGRYRPLVDAGITKGEAARIVERADMLNPVYKWRSSCSCFCCPFQRVSDWRNMARNHPSLYALAESWERESMANSNGFTWREGTTLERLRQADESQLRMLTDTREEACAICQW